MKKYFLFLQFLISTIALSQNFQVPVYSLSSLQPAQPGSGVSNAIDGNVNTIYHSKWGQSGIPDELKFYFSSQVVSINKIVYTPRQSGTNGIWTNISVSYSTQNNPTDFLPLFSNVTWALNNQDKELNISPAIQNPFAIKIIINQAGGNFSSCAELKFYSSDSIIPPFDGNDCSISTQNLTLNGANDIEATILSNGSSASSFQGGENIDKSFDNNLNTLYHSSYNNTSFPVVLNYRFSGNTPIDFFRYIPRSDGGTNGNFGNVVISYNTASNSTFQNLMSFNFNQSGLPATVHFPFQITPLNIQISVEDGSGNFASCAEMKFYTSGSSTINMPYLNVFANNLYATLQPGITQQIIDTISNTFYRNLAQCIYNGTFISQYRVQNFEVFQTLSSLRQTLKVGTYDNFENATGIVFDSNEKIAVFASNIPSNASVLLAVKDFLSGFDGPVSYFELQNGLNVFQLTNGGLGYVAYFSNDTTLGNVQLNIVNGKVNGYFDQATSLNNEWPDLLLNTAYPYIDIRGKYAHLVYQKESLRNGCPFDGNLLISRYDTIIQHQRMLMGWNKYNINPKNRILTYNEYGNGYYAGGLGVHFDLDWGEDDLTNPNHLGLWGIAHEYGHVNQIRPDIKWIGTTEVSVNIYTVWTDYQMNFGNNLYTRLESESVAPAVGMASIEGGRINGALYNTVVNNEHLQGNQDYDVFKVLVPFWQLQVYYQLAGACLNAPELSFSYPGNYSGFDFARWFGKVAQLSRNTDSEGLTNGELLLNFVKNTCVAVEQDLTVFFQKTGFLKPISIQIDDYGIGELTITQQQIDETLTYIQNLGYPQPVSPVIHYASAHSINMYKNQLPLSGTTGVGVSLAGNYLNVVHSEWQNAVAYETYDSNNQLIFVSISGTGDLSNQSTKVYYPSNALAVYAVGYNGQRILVYPTSLLNSSSVFKDEKFIISPNPVGNENKVSFSFKDKSSNYRLNLFSSEGKMILQSKGTIEFLENVLNEEILNIQKGLYFVSLTNNDNSYRTKLIKQ